VNLEKKAREFQWQPPIKPKTPNPNFKTNPKPKFQTAKRAFGGFGFCHWDLFGIWDFDIWISMPLFLLKLYILSNSR
jgi:hypothetical protein